MPSYTTICNRMVMITINTGRMRDSTLFYVLTYLLDVLNSSSLNPSSYEFKMAQIVCSEQKAKPE